MHLPVGRGRPDLTFANGVIFNYIKKWEVLDIESLSDHQYVGVQLDFGTSNINDFYFKTKYNKNKFFNNFRKLLPELYKRLDEVSDLNSIDLFFEFFVNSVSDCAFRSFRKKARGRFSRKLSFWNPVLKSLRNKAGLAAIDFAAGWALDKNVKIKIFTDSKSSIEALRSANIKSSFVLSIKEYLYKAKDLISLGESACRQSPKHLQSARHRMKIFNLGQNAKLSSEARQANQQPLVHAPKTCRQPIGKLGLYPDWRSRFLRRRAGNALAPKG
ncbi:hypothetical protein AVEN_156096-1 [Araneus ventricosus]|uniref:Endonuclease/exonuclease/phosphatase domain-containing protein n=1 Tax=Araneus ventricosus TaxID=182803 RepID=A0A4Y2K4Q4_ARAVE|nr:hypothetical protein AVEN_156096-1 [Araneus ventricosus]